MSLIQAPLRPRQPKAVRIVVPEELEGVEANFHGEKRRGSDKWFRSGTWSEMPDKADPWVMDRSESRREE
jgi:hypothetical protein